MVTKDIAGMERIGFDRRAARRVTARRAQMMQPFQVAALSLPVADRVIDKLELTNAAEIGDRED
jgi:hypothetical protein